MQPWFEYSPAVILGSIVLLLILVPPLGRRFIRIAGIVIVPQDRLAIVTKKFAISGARRLADGHIIALRGEPGTQADTLPPGMYFNYFPWQFAITLEEFLTVPQGMLGVVEARDGAPIGNGAVLGRHVECDSFQNARAFLSSGGQRGPQISIIPPGVYRINTEVFEVTLKTVTQIPDKRVGIVTTLDGRALDTGEIAGRIVPAHSRFQDGQAFVDAGGYKGVQEEVLLAGTYFLNPLFARVSTVDLIEVPIGSVGVVVSYIGSSSGGSASDWLGLATSDPKTDGRPGSSPKHGKIVPRGEKGVWSEPLDPGRYPINPETHFIEIVPTTNIVLNWATDKTESHALDKDLSTIRVTSRDGFSFNLDVSQIIHIPRDRAPAVIARFGSVLNLVTQVLRPLIGNYFRNSAQECDVIDFLRQRRTRQAEAAQQIREAIAEHDVEAVDTLIGDIEPPATLMETISREKIAQQQVAMLAAQETAAEAQQKLAFAQAEAETRGQVVTASRRVEVARLEADAAIERARGDAGAKRANADADAYVESKVGEATANRTLAIGRAEAEVQRSKIDSIGGDTYAFLQIGEQLAKSGVKLVPDVMVSGAGAEGQSGSIASALIGRLLQGHISGTERSRDAA